MSVSLVQRVKREPSSGVVPRPALASHVRVAEDGAGDGRADARLAALLELHEVKHALDERALTRHVLERAALLTESPASHARFLGSCGAADAVHGWPGEPCGGEPGEELAVSIARDGTTCLVLAVRGKEGAYDEGDASTLRLLGEALLDRALERRARRDATTAEARLAALLERPLVGLYLGEDGRIEFCNGPISALLEATAAERLGTRPPPDVADVQHCVVSVDGQPVLKGIVTHATAHQAATARAADYVARLERALDASSSAICRMIELRDPYTAAHGLRVGELAAAIGHELGLEARRVQGLRVAGQLHDVGKINVPAEILAMPRRLSPEEFALVKMHAAGGHRILRGIEFPWPVADVAWQHHERLDGSGYPRGLRGAEIILESRIMAVSDVVESMTTHRPYRPSLGLDAALAVVCDGRGTLYDEHVVDACVRLFRLRAYRLAE